MQNKFEPHPSTIDKELEKIKEFGQLLSKVESALAENATEIASTLGVSGGMLSKWKTGEDFPKPKRLPAIAIAYNIDLRELTRVFEISKKARDKEKNDRKLPPHKKRVFSDESNYNIPSDEYTSYPDGKNGQNYVRRSLDQNQEGH